MSNVTVKIPTPLRHFVDNQKELIVSADQTVKSALDNLVKTYPQLQKHVFDEQNQVRKFINVYLNETDIRHENGENTQISDNDVLSLVPSIAGG